jgi:DNA-binding MarR family transcriptional regulator
MAVPAARTANEDPLEGMLCFALYATAHAFNRAYKPLLDALGLTYPQYLAMLVLWRRDGLTVKAIGERLRLDSGTLTPLLKRLEAMGLVSRARDAADERQLRVALTAKGRALHARAAAVPEAMRRALGCSAAELRGLEEQLHRLRARLDAAAPYSAPGRRRV